MLGWQHEAKCQRLFQSPCIPRILGNSIVQMDTSFHSAPSQDFADNVDITVINKTKNVLVIAHKSLIGAREKSEDVLMIVKEI